MSLGISSKVGKDKLVVPGIPWKAFPICPTGAILNETFDLLSSDVAQEFLQFISPCFLKTRK